MVEAPEKIWLSAPDEVWFEDSEGRTEYTRSDIAERQIAELRAELNANPRWKPKAEELAVKLVAAEAENARLSEANRKLHRRAQGAEGLLQNASNVAREQIETLESVATKAGHWPAGSHWAKRAMERWLESVLSDSTQPALPLKDEVERPDFWAVQSKTGMHIGLWTDRADADEAMHEYEGGTIMPLFRSSLLSRLRAGEREGWRSMDSAPKDGTNILYRNQFRDIGFCHWDEGYDDDDQPCWWDNEADQEVCPVVWLPADILPAFPAAPSEQGGDRG